MNSHQHWRKQLLASARTVDAKLAADLRSVLGDENVLVDEPMSQHTTYRIGGPADYFLKVQTMEQLARVQQAVAERSVPVFVLGGGSNVLVQDGGIRGIVLKLGSQFDYLDVSQDGNDDLVQVGAAVSTGQLMKAAKQHGWVGVAPIGGTPGTIGGALKMNAGGRSVWLGEFVASVNVVTRDGKQTTITKEKLSYGYRSSKLPTGAIITGGTLKFERGDAEAVRAEIDAHIQKRRETQPLNQPSGGSVFRNPDNWHAAELIEKSGVKGVRLHDAQVSEKHANFIVNLGNAHARDVVALIKMTKQKVFEEAGIKLEEELRIVGEPLEADDDN